MPKPKYHAFICTNQRPEGHPKGCCYERKSMDVWQKFAEILNQKQAYDKIQISGVRSCLGPCQFGPVVIVYPEAVWYGSVQPEDVEEIFESHFENGKPLERLLIPQEIFA
ncbi:NAD-reducing hydrogenase subunit HoxF [hydrothermal vent metagenome]|uniref:NAD-reducing hydrogenase subunit HoxF n=1 Tax=hydrothermal vent metagenome TaxID=652676 RepID=A0A3B1BNB2_9ZZZZ